MNYRVIVNHHNSLSGMGHNEVIDIVTENPYLLGYVRDQTPEICLAAVRADSYSLKYMGN